KQQEGQAVARLRIPRPSAAARSPAATGPAPPSRRWLTHRRGYPRPARLGALIPVPQSLGQVEILRHLPDRTIALLTQLHDLGLELWRERTTRPRPLLTHALHDAGHPSGAPPAPDLGCPSKRVRPTGRPRSLGLNYHAQGALGVRRPPGDQFSGLLGGLR